MVKVDLDLLGDVRDWYIEEINAYFRSIGGQEKVLVESRLIPALEKILPCRFDTVEWWPEGRETKAPEGKAIKEQVSLKSFFKKWFGSN